MILQENVGCHANLCDFVRQIIGIDGRIIEYYKRNINITHVHTQIHK